MSDYLKDLYDIRVRPERPARGRGCDWPGCDLIGDYRAPKSPTSLSEHVWFCLDHVRAYNAGWDFFAGMNEAQIERFQGTASTWHRPTWTLAENADRRSRGRADPRAHFDPDLLDPLSIFGRGHRTSQSGAPLTRRRELSDMVRGSLSALELDESAALKDIKARYKQLVKRYHPDANGGDHGSADRLKRIIEAYRHLVSSGLFR